MGQNKIRTDSLSKGQWISPARLERVFGLSQDSNRFNLLFEQLKRRIQDESDAMGKPLLCKQECRGLRILTDSEALFYKQQQHRSTVRRLYRIGSELYRIHTKSLLKSERKILREEKDLQQSILDTIDTIMEEII